MLLVWVKSQTLKDSYYILSLICDLRQGVRTGEAEKDHRNQDKVEERKRKMCMTKVHYTQVWKCPSGTHHLILLLLVVLWLHTNREAQQLWNLQEEQGCKSSRKPGLAWNKKTAFRQQWSGSGHPTFRSSPGVKLKLNTRWEDTRSMQFSVLCTSSIQRLLSGSLSWGRGGRHFSVEKIEGGDMTWQENLLQVEHNVMQKSLERTKPRTATPLDC